MQGSFEKEVQEKLDELKLTPGAPVWEKIERQIQPQEKRRRGIFWLFFLALLIVGGWLMFTQTNGNKKGLTAKTGYVLDKTSKIEKRPGTMVKSEPTKEDEFKKENIEPQKLSRDKSKPVISTNVVSLLNHQKKTIKKNFVDEENTLTDERPLRINEKKAAGSKRNTSAGIETNHVNKNTEPTQNADVAITQPVTKADSIAQSKAEGTKTESAPTTVDSSKKKIAAVQKKWTNKILFSAGWSGVASPNSYPSYAAIDYTTGIPANNGGTPTYQPSKITKGFSFSVGYAKEKALADRLMLSIGLQYAYYSTHQKIGGFKSLDTAVRFLNDALAIPGYYSSVSAVSSSPTDYTTHFHTIELPIAFTYQLLKKIPLQLTTGVSYGRLLSSNALTFDPLSGVYYLNKQNNKKNYLNLFAALHYSILNQKSWKLSIGPTIRYNAMALQKVSSNKQHLVFAGIGTAVEF